MYFRKIYIFLLLDSPMKRKIVQHGSSSLTVTLPNKWAEKYHLKKGEEINVEESGPLLIISTGKEAATDKKEISASEYGVFTKNNLSHLYQLGYDELEIHYEDAKVLEEIKSRLPECMGFEIIDQKKNTVYIKSIAATLESEFDMLLRKAFLITNEMAKEIAQSLEKGDYSHMKEIQEIEVLNNKFTDICIRILNKRGYKNPKRTMQAYEVVKNIERVADEFKYICELLKDCKKPLSKEAIQSFKEAVEYYMAFYNMFYKFDVDLKKKIYEGRGSLIKKYELKLQKSAGIEAIFLHYLMNIVLKTFDGAGGYFSLVL